VLDTSRAEGRLAAEAALAGAEGLGIGD